MLVRVKIRANYVYRNCFKVFVFKLIQKRQLYIQIHEETEKKTEK